MARADHVISSREWETETPTIDGSPTDVTAAAGGLYLKHLTASLSLLDRVVAAMTTAGVADADAFITEAGYVRLTSSGTFTITWGAATTLRDLLGFTGDLAAASAYTAANRSTLLWRPGKRMTPELAPLGARGQLVADLSVQQGKGGVQTVREEGTEEEVQRYVVRRIPKARYWGNPATGLAAGDLGHFWRYELKTSQRFIVLRDVVEGQSTTTAADLSSATVVGPYVADLTQPEMQRLQFTRSSGFELVEKFYDARIPCIGCEEFSA